MMQRLYLTFLLSIHFCSSCSGPPVVKKSDLELAETGKHCAQITLVSSIGGYAIRHYLGYVLSYNSCWYIPNWVAYELTAEEVVSGSPPFRGVFVADTTVSFVQSDGYDFRGSGWSRGHMAPAADFKWSRKAYGDTFYYTNCCPQDQSMNNGSWNVLENHVRRLAKKYGAVYVVTGPVVGTNRFGKIGAHQVVVPDGFFKALLVNRNNSFYAIGFYMENVPEKQPIKECYLTIDELEKLTGFDFFPFLEDNVENSIEAEVNTSIWFK